MVVRGRITAQGLPAPHSRRWTRSQLPRLRRMYPPDEVASVNPKGTNIITVSDFYQIAAGGQIIFT